MKFTRLAVVALALGSVPSMLSQVYISDGSGVVTFQPDADPAHVHPDEWQVALYANGAPQLPGTSWGLLCDKTAAGVMAQLKRSQKLEIAAAELFGRDWRSNAYTHFNAQGPIAVFRRKSSGAAGGRSERAANRMLGVRQQIEGMTDACIRAIRQVAASGRGRFSSVGLVTKEYADRLRVAQDELNTLQSRLEVAGNSAFDDIEPSLRPVLDNLDAAKRADTQLKREMPELQEAERRPQDLPGGGLQLSSHTLSIENGRIVYDDGPGRIAVDLTNLKGARIGTGLTVSFGRSNSTGHNKLVLTMQNGGTELWFADDADAQRALEWIRSKVPGLQ